MNSRTMEPEAALDAEFSAGPGRRLRQTREAAGMSLEAVATKLRLDPKIVAAIEADDYAKLPAPAFVRGYIGSYARLLELPHEPLMAAYQAQGVAPPQVHATRRIEEGGNRPGGWWRWVGYGIGVAFILVGIVAYWQGASAPPPTSEELVEEAPIPTPALPPLQPPPGDDESDAEDTLDVELGGTTKTLQNEQAEGAPGDDEPTGEERNPDADEKGVDEGGLADVEAAGADAEPIEVVQVSELDAPVDALPGLIEPASEEPEEAVDTTTVAVVETVNGGAEATTTESKPTPPPEPVAPTLLLKTTKDAWVSIRDADGKRLVYGTIEAGDTKTVVGAPPLRLVVGNAEAVSVTWNGKPFDKAPYTEKGVARFTVGGPQ